MNTTRRTFLRASGITLALPWLESMGAGENAPPRRLFAICQDLGFIPSRFFPKTTGADYEPSPYLAEIDAYRNHFSVFSGLSHPEVDGGHRADQSFLTAAPHPGRPSFRNQISLDQEIANQIGHQTRFRSLALSVNLSKSLSFTQAGVEIPPVESAAALYRQLFLQGEKVEVEQQIERLKRRGSILDVVMDQSKSVERRVTPRDRDRIEQFQTAVRDLEMRLQEQQVWETRPKPKVARDLPTDPESDKAYFEKVRLMYEMATLALQTDSTRLVTLFLSSATTPGVILPDGTTHPGYHGISHHGKDENKLARLRLIETEQMRAFGDLLGGLQAATETDGSLLDHTSVLYGSNLGDANVHNNKNLPVILAGGGFRHGQHHAFDKERNAPLCDLYVTLLQSMGIEASEFGSSQGDLNSQLMA